MRKRLDFFLVAVVCLLLITVSLLANAASPSDNAVSPSDNAVSQPAYADSISNNAASRPANSNTLPTNALALARILRSRHNDQRIFELCGQIISRMTNNYPVAIVRDETGCIPVAFNRGLNRQLTSGDRIKCRGWISEWGEGNRSLLVNDLTVLAHDQVPTPPEVTPDDIYSGKCDYVIVRLTGTIIDVFQDEANSRFSFIVLSVNGTPINIPSTVISTERLTRLIGASVAIAGTCSPYCGFGPRAKLEYEVYLNDENDIQILSPAPADPFDVLALEGGVYPIICPKPGDSMRRKVTGRVEAVARDNRLSVRTATGALSSVQLLPDAVPPKPGATIDATGIAETDFFQLNLARARWRPADSQVPASVATPTDTSIHALYFDATGKRRFDAEMYGKLVRVSGTIFNLETEPDGSGIIQLRENDDFIAIDASSVAAALDELEVGCRIRATGLCLAETECWRPQAPFPHIKGLSIVLREKPDLVLISRPPWWTPARLWQAILILAFALILLFAYSSVITRIIRRRTVELDRERRTRERADIKKIERTRLAIDLHDSLAQSINGCTMEVEAALEIGSDDTPAMIARIELVRRSLQACREELRNSIWDLRSDALEEATLERAILRTLAPLVNKARLAVKFAIARERLPDNTCHAVIKIVRELTLNALHHGNAKLVRIAGKIEDDCLFFSVIDDGCGFDVDHHPGIQQGHFGLQGVKERVKSLGGAFALTSKPGHGAKARVSIPINSEVE